jgi:prefoldin subunit 5
MNPQQLQAVLQVIFDRLKALEDEIAQLKKEMSNDSHP